MPPTRHRQSTQTVASPATRATQTPAPNSNRVPDYEPLQNPLNAKAQQSLSFLLRSTGTLGHIKAHLAHSGTRLAECVALVNDRNVELQDSVNRRRAKGREIDEKDEEYAQKLDEKVRKATEVLEVAMRGVVDMERGVGILEEGVRDVGGRVAQEGNANAARVRGAQGMGSQRQKRRRIVDEDGEEDEDQEDEDEEMEEAEVRKVVPTAPSVMLRDTMKEKAREWEGTSARERYVLQLIRLFVNIKANSFSHSYARANHYITFVKTAHDAAHPEENGPPLPDASTWFDDANNPTQPYYNKPETHKSQDEGESELVTTSVRISIKCPITTLTFTDPVTSTVCPHSFERKAIEELISKGRTTKVVDRATGRQEPAVPCPECRTLIAKSELRDDPVLLRKVQRIVAQENRGDGDEEESDEEPSGPRQAGNEEGDSSIMESGANATQNGRGAAGRIKRENMLKSRLSETGAAAAARVSATQREGTQVIPATQVAPSATQQSMIVDLEGDDEDEEEEEEEGGDEDEEMDDDDNDGTDSGEGEEEGS
jgi:E3 SUMO-protein ligase NSE2